MQLPSHVVGLIEERVESVGLNALRKASQELSLAYRQGPALSLANPEYAIAYLATRMPGTYAAACAVMKETRARLHAVIDSTLDVGAGSGAASLAALKWFNARRITLVEREPGIAEVAHQFLPEAEVLREDFTRISRFPPHDLVIACYAFGEARQFELLDRIWQAARVALVIIEPGTPRGFSLIREIRSRLLSAGARMIAPCPGEGRCPMIAPDWCHFGARIERTSIHRRLKDAELNYEDEKFSYIAVSRTLVKTAAARIIRRPRQQPRLITLEICTPDGTQTIRAMKRDRAAFRAARQCAWGGEWKLDPA